MNQVSTEPGIYPGTIPPPLPKTLSKGERPFTDDEYHARIKNAAKELATLGADALVIFDGGNICYLCGYLGESSYVPQALVIDPRETYPKLFMRRQDAAAGMYFSFMPNENVDGYSEAWIGHPEKSPFTYIFDAIIESGRTTLALEFDAMSGATLKWLEAHYPNLRLVDASGLIHRLRLIKSPAEIAIQKDAARITNHVMAQVPSFFETSIHEYEVAAKITSGLITGVDGLCGHLTDPLVMPGGQHLTGTSHVTWTDRSLMRGQHYNPEFGAARHGYNVGIMRSIAYGPPSEKLKSLTAAMADGSDAAIAKVRPGALLGALAQAYCDELHKNGYWKDSRCGYPIGIRWMEDSCSVRTDDTTVLKPGMVFHLMLGTWLEEDFGAVTSETFVVTETGCEVLTSAPRGLIIVS